MTGKEMLMVGEVNEYGFKVSGKQYNLSPKYNGPKIEAGMVLDATVYTSPKGAKYVNGAVLSVSSVAVAPVVVAEQKRAYVKKAEKKESVNEDAKWDAINRGKTASLFVEAILSNPNMSPSLADIDVDKIQAVVEPLVDFVFGTRKVDASK